MVSSSVALLTTGENSLAGILKRRTMKLIHEDPSEEVASVG